MSEGAEPGYTYGRKYISAIAQRIILAADGLPAPEDDEGPAGDDGNGGKDI